MQSKEEFPALLELRRLHVEMDLDVRDTYGWQNLDLWHDFFGLETLAENDRIRYTISPAARREVLTRILTENQERVKAESQARPAKKTTPQKKPSSKGPGLFDAL